MNKFKRDLKKFLTPRRALLLMILLLVGIFWFQYIAGVVILGLFIPITFITVRYSKMVPHISIESNTAMTFFVGYVFGPIFALIYGPIIGIGCYVINSFVSPAYISTPIIAGISGALVGFLHESLQLSFVHAFIIGLVSRTIIAFPWFMLFNDPVEVVTHQVTQFFSNLIIYLPLLSALYSIVNSFIHG